MKVTASTADTKEAGTKVEIRIKTILGYNKALLPSIKETVCEAVAANSSIDRPAPIFKSKMASTTTTPTAGIPRISSTMTSVVEARRLGKMTKNTRGVASEPKTATRHVRKRGYDVTLINLIMPASGMTISRTTSKTATTTSEEASRARATRTSSTQATRTTSTGTTRASTTSIMTSSATKIIIMTASSGSSSAALTTCTLKTIW